MKGLAPRFGSDIFTNMMDNLQETEVGLRLRAERKRLGLTQSQLGARGGVSLSSQHAYESGLHRPDTRYLARVAEAGVDMQYVVLGQKTEPRSPSNLDWKAMEAIGLLIEQSATEPGEQMPLALKFHFLRVFYEQYLANRQLDTANYAVTLKLMGSGRAS
jgi:transcriptional regulator with XRE-family HTH domain